MPINSITGLTEYPFSSYLQYFCDSVAEVLQRFISIQSACFISAICLIVITVFIILTYKKISKFIDNYYINEFKG